MKQILMPCGIAILIGLSTSTWAGKDDHVLVQEAAKNVVMVNQIADNDALLKVMRKVFLPEITANTPIGQQVDLWMTLNLEELTPEQALINIKARNQVIQHIEMRLMELKMLAGMKEETVEQTKERLKRDSSK